MADLLSLSSVRSIQGTPTQGTSHKKLEESCRQFEGFFLAELMKKSQGDDAASPGEEKKSFGPLAETALEMSARAISAEGEGVGLWKVLYNDLCRSLPDDEESGTDLSGGKGEE